MVIDQLITERFALYNGDCIEVMQEMAGGAIDLSVYSPPFCALYTYSNDLRDLSNSRSYKEFFDHYAIVVEEMARITKPGRCTAVHAMDVPDSCNLGNYLTDFPGDIIRLHEVYQAVVMGRRGVGVELKTSYYRQAVKNVQIAGEERKENQADLFGSSR